MMQKIIKNPESGRSLLEIVGVLAIMMLMSVGALILVRSATMSQKRAAVMDEVSKIVTGIRTLYADYDDLSDLDGNGAMAAMGVSTKGAIKDSVYSVTRTLFNRKYTRFTVTISGLNTKDCIALGRRAWPDSVDRASCKNGAVTITYEK